MAEKEYIERGALLEKLNSDLARWVDSATEYKEDRSGMHAMKEAILYAVAAPAADVVEVVHGEWIFNEKESESHIEPIYNCSECNYDIWGDTEKTNYCPYCGAKMDGKQ